MDPEANLEEQLALANEIVNGVDEDGNADESDTDAREERAARLAELVLALNEWITNGGFLPTSWKRG